MSLVSLRKKCDGEHNGERMNGRISVIVTTYESELALQLMEDVPSASLIYVTTSR